MTPITSWPLETDDPTGLPAEDDEAVAEARPKPSRRTLTLIVGPIIAIIVAGTIANAIHPQLLTRNPLLLIALEPRNRYLVLVAQKVEFVPFLLVATIRRLISDPLFYLLGYLYGDSGVRWIENRMGEGGGLIRGFERAFAKAAPVMVFLFPGAIVCVLAGATGMSIPVFIVLNLVGTVTAVWVMYAFADLVEGPVGAINNFYGNNSKWLTIASITFTVLWLIAQRRQGRGIQSISEVEADLHAGEAPETDTRP